jgi:two-component system, cell cycle response regulator
VSSSTLVHAALLIRKTARATFGFAFALAFGALVLLGVFRTPSFAIEHGVVALAWLAIFGVRLKKRVRERAGADDTKLLDLELGLMLLIAVHAGVQAFGGLEGPFYPLVYVAVALLASFARSPIGSILVLCAIALEGAILLCAQENVSWERYALHGVFIGLFGALNVLFTRAEIARVRERSKQELDQEREKVREDARLFRLASPASGQAVRDEDKVFRSSLAEVRDSLYHVLDLMKKALGLHTCVLLMRDEASGKLSIVELATDSDDVADGPFGPGEGAVGAALSRGLAMNLENLKPGYKGLCYYRGPALVRSFLGVPVIENGTVRGVLCADRLDDRAFTALDEDLFKTAIAQALRAIQNERVFVQLERAKSEQSYLYKASQALGEALTEEQVIDAGLGSARDIAPYDFGAITLYDAKKRSHRVRRAVGEGSAQFAALTFRDNTSLTAMAVKNKHYLPYRGEFDSSQQVVFTKRAKLPPMRSLLILPLVVREDAIGTLALAAQRPDAFHDGVRGALSVLANQLAVAMSNAAAVRRLEEMATTDGLTGCLNKRAFLDELEAKIRSAERFGRKLSLLVTDLDHFKSVNDTYGHDVGDVVIKGLGAILQSVKRDTDSVARFGGEEFCVLCEETDTPGAIKLAERVREELSAAIFPTDLGKLRITCSIGVATFPNDAKSPEELFKITDQALYAAKRSGRNRVCTSRDV